MEKNLTTSTTEPALNAKAVTQICLNLRAIAPRSYEKTFKGMDDRDVISGLMICLSDLTQGQVMTGLNHVRDMGWIPDPAMLRRWCLGQFDFSAENTNKVRDSYHGANAALNNLIGWLEEGEKGNITNAEKMAYNRTYRAFNHLKFDGSKNSVYLAHQAFKENYVEVVNELVEAEQVQCIWESPKRLEKPDEPIKFKTVRKDYLSKMSLEDIKRQERITERAKELESEGMAFGAAMMKAAKELLGGINKHGNESGLL